MISMTIEWEEPELPELPTFSGCATDAQNTKLRNLRPKSISDLLDKFGPLRGKDPSSTQPYGSGVPTILKLFGAKAIFLI